MVYAVEALADAGGYSIEVSSSLSGYADRDIYLPASELSFFNYQGKLIVGDTLYALGKEKIMSTSLISGEQRSYPLAMDAYRSDPSNHDVETNRLCGPNEDPPGCEEPPPPPPPCEDCGDDPPGDDLPPVPNPTIAFSYDLYVSATDGGFYRTRAKAYNKSYRTKGPLFRSWSKGGTIIQYYDYYSYEWRNSPAAMFPGMSTSVTVISEKRNILFQCREGSTSDSGTHYAKADRGRCDNTGTESSHTAEIENNPYYWPSGLPEIYLY